MSGSWIRILTEAEWELIRRGKATASEFAKAVATVKGGWATSRKRYAGKLITQRLGGQTANGYVNDAMRWGIATEAPAILAYQEKMKDRDGVVFRAPDGHRLWAEHPTIPGCAATPDALFDDGDAKTGDGIIEIKCPYESDIHLERYEEGFSDNAYRVQALFQLLCLPERTWVDLVSYDPRMPDHMQLVYQRLYRDDVSKELATLEAQAEKFIREVDERVAGYRRRGER